VASGKLVFWHVMHYQMSVLLVPKTLGDTLQTHGDCLSERPHTEFVHRRPLIGKTQDTPSVYKEAHVNLRIPCVQHIH